MPVLFLFVLVSLAPFAFQKDWPRVGLALLFSLSIFFFVTFSYSTPQIGIGEKISGKGEVQIYSLTKQNRNYANYWVYRGILISFIPTGGKESIASHVPVSLMIQNTDERPPANLSYAIQGVLSRSSGTIFYLKSSPADWKPIQGSYSFAEMRYKAKQSVKDYLKKKLPDPRSSSFLQGIATGEFEDAQMVFELGRFGLQHILAISGFHFGLLALILATGLKFFFDSRITSLILILLLTSYFLFLGFSPSVMRSWVTIVIAMGSYLVERPSSALNSLGAGLLVTLAWDPHSCHHLGFQFSFLVTAAILLFYSPFETLLCTIFPKRPIYTALQLDRINKVAYCLLAFFRKGLSLSLAVNLVAVPLTLYYFHKVPLMGVLYNLFFPFLVGVSMLLLILGILCEPLFSPISSLIHSFNSSFTRITLDFAYNVPPTMDAILRIDDFEWRWLILYFWFLLFVHCQFELRRDNLTSLSNSSNLNKNC